MKSHRLWSLATVGAIVTTASLATAPQAVAEPYTHCECVAYVQNYIGHINTMLAKDSDAGLRALGWNRVSDTPMGINDIVVLQPGFNSAVNPSAGHIAWLAKYSTQGNTTSIMLRGANQGNLSTWNDHGCNNVSQWSFSYPNGKSGIKFYRK
jgi:hypothetical protein